MFMRNGVWVQHLGLGIEDPHGQDLFITCGQTLNIRTLNATFKAQAPSPKP